MTFAAYEGISGTSLGGQTVFVNSRPLPHIPLDLAGDTVVLDLRTWPTLFSIMPMVAPSQMPTIKTSNGMLLRSFHAVSVGN